MPAKFHSIALIGLNAVPIDVEADISRATLPTFKVVGLPDTSVREAKERVRAAIKNSGLPFPRARITVNLAPAHIRKEGPGHDLAMALAIVAATGPPQALSLSCREPVERSKGSRRLFLGELALDGSVRPVIGALPAVMAAIEDGFDEIYVPRGNSEEAALALGKEKSDTKLFPVSSLAGIFSHLTGMETIECAKPIEQTADKPGTYPVDFSNVHGQEHAKRALEIAASGNHNILMSGPPGSGKTMLARALPSILPEMIHEEVLEVTKIRSIAGTLEDNAQLVTARPFRSPHHSASGVALIGGGSWPRPGEISLAHRGVLFLDEFPEFPRSVLENLRQPLEEGFVTVSRAQCTLRFPAKFTLVAAQNPCPCGYLTDPSTDCTCGQAEIERYRRRVSGPLLDRIDLHIEVPRVKPEELLKRPSSEPSARIRERVESARDRARQRLKSDNIITNGEMGHLQIRRHCALDTETENFLCTAAERMNLSARAVSRSLKVARTIADLAGSDTIKKQHLAEALQFRTRR
ncbi:MAG: YifB family Mg chelatase-like AAA ATPase [Patescibacteria group bacterium]|nr:YifB family Mg chelatase-like AAA ATPase [Patescibacteria group bacterium]